MTLRRIIGALFVALMLWSLPATVQAQAKPPWDPEVNLSRGEDLEIELLTFGEGDGIHVWFGHAGVAVRDKRLRRELLYNYGMFTFSQSFVFEFLRGRLNFWVGTASYKRSLQFYKKVDRDVFITRLNLTPEERLEAARYMANNVRPENRGYLYHHFDDNCATRPRDLIDMMTRGAFKKKAKATPARMTIREHVRRHALMRVLEYGMSYAMSHEIDRPITNWEEMFLPSELRRSVLDFEYTDSTGATRKLAAEDIHWYKAKVRKPTPAEPQTLWPMMLALGLLVVLGQFLLARWWVKGRGRAARVLFGLYQAGVGMVYGGAGMLLVLMWLLTDHRMTWHNENLLQASPLLLLAVPLGLSFARGKNPATLGRLVNLWYVALASSVLGVALKVLPWFTQQNWLTIVMILPMLIGVAGTLRWTREKSVA